MSKKAILVASFGTSYEQTRQNNIIAVEKEIAAAFPLYKIYSAYTSNMVRKILAKKGIEVNDAPSALAEMEKDGITDIILQPTHLLYGDEYDKVCAQVLEKEYAFNSIKISTPLLADTEDMKKVLNILNENIKCEQDECIVFMGHGTEHFCNTIYSSLDYMAKAEGLNHIFIGTVEAYPTVETVLSLVKKAGYKRAVLSPLMLVAGDHATNDMASDEEDSWRTIFEQNGIQTRCIVKGLGEYPQIREMYTEHITKTIGEE